MTGDARYVWSLCKDCGSTVSNPYPDNRVAQLLFGTAAQESNFQARRQSGFKAGSLRGGFGLWQLERESVTDSLILTRSKAVLREKSIKFIGDAYKSILDRGDPEVILQMMVRSEGDRLSCLFSRLHYLRVHDPIPPTVPAHAQYWKTFYNTVKGKGTVSQYLANWKSLCSNVANETP